MDELRRQYLKRLPSRMANLDAAVEFLSACVASANIAKEISPVLGIAHGLAGSGATFGFPELSVHAK